MHRDTVTRSWGPLSCHSSATITSCYSMIMHSSMMQGSVHNSWKLKTSQLLHGLHSHQTYHPLSMFGMLLISVFQFMPVSSNFALPLKRSGPTFHRSQSTTWSTLCEGDVSHNVSLMMVTPATDISDPPVVVGGIWDQKKQICSPCHVKSIVQFLINVFFQVTTVPFSVAFYWGQLKTHLCTNYTV